MLESVCKDNDLYMYLKPPCIIREFVPSAISLLYLHVYICTAIGQYKMMAHKQNGTEIPSYFLQPALG